MKENRINSFNVDNYQNDIITLNKEEMFVYRIDSRSPGTIMVDGFKSLGDNYDISGFIFRPQDDAGFISTSISNPSEMLAQYQLRGIIMNQARDDLIIKNPDYELLKDQPEPVGMPDRWAYHIYEGTGTALVYKIMLNPGQGIDVENSTFLNSDTHIGQKEISVIKEIKTDQVISVYEITLNFPIIKMAQLTENIIEKKPHQVLTLHELAARSNITKEPLWEANQQFKCLFNDEVFSKDINIKLVAETKKIFFKKSKSTVYSFELSIINDSLDKGNIFRIIKVSEVDESLILNENFATTLAREILSHLYIGDNSIKSSAEFSTAEPIMYKLKKLDSNITNPAVFEKNTKKLRVLGETIDFSVWESPDQAYFTSLPNTPLEPEGTHYEKTLIFQLQGDDTCFEASRALFNKHRYTSEWLQLGDGKPAEVFTWGETYKKFVYTSPLKLDKEGKIRITLVGHGETEGDTTTFGGMNAETLKGHLSSLFARLGSSSVLIKGITLNLTGCSLLNPKQPLADTLPGQLAIWLKQQAEILGLDDSNWSVNARENDLLVLENGKKEIRINDHWINKEVADIHGLVYKTKLVWNKETQSLYKLPLSIEELQQVTPYIDDAIATHNQLDSQSATLLEEMHRQVSQRISELLLLNEKHESHRNEIEQRVSELLELVNLGNEWNDAASQLHLDNHLDEHWYATFTVQAGENGGHQVAFVNLLTDKIQYISTSESIFSEFSQRYEQLLGHFSSGLMLDKQSGKIIAKPNVLEGEAAHTLNAAFMLQTLMNINPSNGGINALSWPLQLQTYTQLAQNTLGLVHDVSAVANLVKLASATELNPLSAATSLLGTVAPGVVGLLLDAANILGMSFQLSASTDPVEINTTIANLTLSSLMVGTNIAALLTSLSAASAAVSGLLGMVAVPLAGIAAGLPALVGNYTTLAEQNKSALTAFDAIQTSVSQPNQLRKISDAGQSPIVWGLAMGAVVDSINFRDNHVHFGSVTSVGSKGGSWHTHSGHWDHYLSGPSIDYGLKLDLYLGLGLKEHTQELDLTDAQIFLLPASAQRHYTFGYDEAPGIRYKNPSALMALGQYYGAQFKWGFYALPTDWAITRLTAELFSTPINVQLDSRARTLIVPTLLDDTERGKLFYQLIGNGGEYTLIMPSKTVAITITCADADKEHWIFDIEALIKQSSVVDNKIVLGALLPERIKAITLHNNILSVGDQHIQFNGKPPVHLLLESRLTLTGVTKQNNSLPTLTLALSVGEQNSPPRPVLMFSDDTLLEQYAEQILQAVRPLASQVAKIPFVAGKSNGVIDIANNRLWLAQSQGQLLLCDGNRLSKSLFPKSAQVLIGPNDKIMATGKMGDLSFNAILEQQSGNIAVSLIYLETVIADATSFSQAPFQEFADHSLGGVIDSLLARYPGSFARENLSFNPQGVWRFASQQGEGFSFALSERDLLSVSNANWSNSQAEFIYNNLYSSTTKTLEVKAKATTVELNLSKQQLELNWLDKNTQIIIFYQDNLSCIGLALNDIPVANLYIAGLSRKNRFTVNILDHTQQSMLLNITDNDFVMRSNLGHSIKVANALNMEEILFFSFLNSQQMSFQKIKANILFSLNKPMTQVMTYFNLESIPNAELIDGYYHFMGKSGLYYQAPMDIAAANKAADIADAADITHAQIQVQQLASIVPFFFDMEPEPTLSNGRAFTVVGYKGPQAYRIPPNIRSISILLQIIQGGTIFNGVKFQNINLDTFFPETGQEAIIWLQKIEMLVTHSGQNQFIQRLMFGSQPNTSIEINIRDAKKFINDYLNKAIKQGGWVSN